jgi:fumarylacetoacetate (FAA) hydrolase
MPGGAAVVTLKDGDSLRIDFKLADGGSPFGAIDMDLAEPSTAAAEEDADAAEGQDPSHAVDDAPDDALDEARAARDADAQNEGDPADPADSAPARTQETKDATT